ncbi:MAG: DMT family transporter [Candidatus Thermoplasmatota archaeon]|nr:DMT family transporter [Candidatus Thermoplasmatota archaeon]
MANPRLFSEGSARYWILLSILAVSTAAILIRSSNSHPLVIAFWRLLIAYVILLPFALRSYKEGFRPSRKDTALMIFTGFVLSVHFASWIWSFQYTKVSSSVLLVTTHPIFVSSVSVLAFKERMHKLAIAGMTLAIFGSVVIVLSDIGMSGHALVGDLLAILGSIMAGTYILAGSRIRKRVSLPVYANVVYGSAFLFLLIAILILGIDFVPGEPVEYIIFAALAIGPMILGHTIYNWALKYISPTFVSVSLLGEPIGSTLLAILFLGELPWAGFYIGAPLALSGIYLVGRYGRRGV